MVSILDILSGALPLMVDVRQTGGSPCIRLLRVRGDDEEALVCRSVSQVLEVLTQLLPTKCIRNGLGLEPEVEASRHTGIRDGRPNPRRLIHKCDELQRGVLSNRSQQALQQAQLKTLEHRHHR